jgi:lipid A oxidase
MANKTMMAAIAVGATVMSVSPALADPVISVYGGVQSATDSDVDTTDGVHFSADWQGKSFSNPPYWGVRGAYWLDDFGYDAFGVSLDYSHTKVYAGKSTLRNETPGWTHLEFTDGLNLVTLNALYRFQDNGRAWTPYIGAGAGVNIPHVEVIRPSGKTWDYQLGGVTAQALAGVDYKVTEHISVFTEYKFDYSHVDVDIDSGAGLKTNILSNAVNFGLSYRF